LKKPVPFGKYYLLERINVGGMAEVFKAKAFGVEGFERLVAVKRILPNIAEDEEFIAMFIDEAKIAVQLQHANIAQIFDLGKVDDSYFIALEYVLGRDLRAMFDRLRQRNEAMGFAQACYIVMQVCEGLDYAHNKRDAQGRELHLVHRDISPQNVLVGFEGEIKLIDFGIAKAAGKASKTQAGILKGKFGYMSPEQVRGLPIDRRSDIFAVGIVLYELLTGERLFMGESDFSTLEKVRNVEIVPPSNYNNAIPEELERIVLKVLAKDPEDRYQNAIDLHDDLQAFLYTKGELYSRKDLAAWMKKTFPVEIEEENARSEQYRRIVAPGSAEVTGRRANASGKTGAGSAPKKDPKNTTKDATNPKQGQGQGQGKEPTQQTQKDQSQTKRTDMSTRSGNDDIEWDDEELDTQIFEKDPTEEPELIETRDIFDDDDDRTVANEPPPDVLRAATAPQLATPQPSAPHAARGAATPTAGVRIPAPSGNSGRIPGPPTGAPRSSLFGVPAPVLPAPLAPVVRPVPSPVGHRTTQTRMPIPAPFSTGSFEAPPVAPDSKSKGKGLAIFFLALLVLGGGSVLAYTWYQNRPGKIEITTNPPESTILVDNVKVAERSPFTIDRAPGSCAVSVVRPGYTRNDQNVLVRAGMTSNLTVTLEPAPDTGFELTSIPPGGLVWLDGNAMTGPDGQARTDFRAYKIPPGKHLLEIKGDPKFQPWSEEIVIEPGTIKRVKAILTVIGGEPARQAPPPPPPAPPPAAAAPGAAPLATGPSTNPGATIHRRVRPRERVEGEEPFGNGAREKEDEPAAAECSITVGTRPWSEIWIDGKNTGRHTPYSENISCGKHKLSFRRPDLNLLRNEVVTIKAGEKFKQSYPLEEE